MILVPAEPGLKSYLKTSPLTDMIPVSKPYKNDNNNTSTNVKRENGKKKCKKLKTGAWKHPE